MSTYTIVRLVRNGVGTWRSTRPPEYLATIPGSPDNYPRLRICLPLSHNGQAHSIGSLAECFTDLVVRYGVTRDIKRVRYARVLRGSPEVRTTYFAVAMIIVISDHALVQAIADIQRRLGGEVLVFEVLPEE